LVLTKELLIFKYNKKDMKILRKNIHLVTEGDMLDLIDNVIKAGFNITDEELDFICETATDEEVEVITEAIGTIDEGASFSKRRSALIIRNKYLDLFNTKE
jgi:hypothetical protein